MEQLILHLLGDYIIQNNWMAMNKTRYTLIGYISCLIHAITYSLPFLLLTNGFNEAWFTIFLTHLIIDKFRLPKIIIMIKDWDFRGQTPFWLLIVVDNTIHLIINYLSIKYLM